MLDLFDIQRCRSLHTRSGSRFIAIRTGLTRSEPSMYNKNFSRADRYNHTLSHSLPEIMRRRGPFLIMAIVHTALLGLESESRRDMQGSRDCSSELRCSLALERSHNQVHVLDSHYDESPLPRFGHWLGVFYKVYKGPLFSPDLFQTISASRIPIDYLSTITITTGASYPNDPVTQVDGHHQEDHQKGLTKAEACQSGQAKTETKAQA